MKSYFKLQWYFNQQKEEQVEYWSSNPSIVFVASWVNMNMNNFPLSIYLCSFSNLQISNTKKYTVYQHGQWRGTAILLNVSFNPW